MEKTMPMITIANNGDLGGEQLRVAGSSIILLATSQKMITLRKDGKSTRSLTK